MAETAKPVFNDAHRLDRICLHLGGEEWTVPLVLATQPVSCPISCGSLRCDAITGDGRTIPVHALADTRIQILSRASAPELATPSGDVLAAADGEDAMSALLAERAGEA